MSNPSQDALTANEQSQAVEREAAVPGGEDRWQDVLMSVACRLELPRSESGPPDDPAVYEKAIDAIEQLYTDELKRRQEAEAKLFATPAHRPSQPGVVTEEMRKLSEAAQQGRWHTNENHSVVLGERTEHDETLFQTVCCAPHRAMSNPDRKRQWYADKAFIVASVNFVRALLAAPSPGASVTASPADGDVIEALRHLAAVPIERPSGGFYPDDDPLVGFDGWHLRPRFVKLARAILSRLEASQPAFEPDPELTDAENEGLRLGTHYMAADCSVRPKPSPAAETAPDAGLVALRLLHTASEAAEKRYDETGEWDDKIALHKASDEYTRAALAFARAALSRAGERPPVSAPPAESGSGGAE